MTPIRIISDLHFGHPGCAIDSVDQLRPLFEEVSETLIINGDACEQRHAKFGKIGERHIIDLQQLADELGIELIFIRGNHDPFISEIDYLKFGSRRQIFVTHGDVFFRDISPWSRRADHHRDDWRKIWDDMLPEVQTDLDSRCLYTDRARQLGAKYKDEFKTGRFKTLKTALHLAWPPRRPYKVIETWLSSHRTASTFADQYCNDAEIVIFGHTHFAGEWSNVRGRRVINTGGFVSAGKARAVDLDGDIVTVCRVEKSTGGEFRITRSL